MIMWGKRKWDGNAGGGGKWVGGKVWVKGDRWVVEGRVKDIDGMILLRGGN